MSVDQPHPASENRPSRSALPIITGLSGLLVGAVVVGAVWIATATMASDRTAADDATAACDLVAGLTMPADGRMSHVDAYRLAAAQAFAQAAVTADHRYSGVSTALNLARQQMMTSPDPAGLTESLETVERHCLQR